MRTFLKNSGFYSKIIQNGTQGLAKSMMYVSCENFSFFVSRA